MVTRKWYSHPVIAAGVAVNAALLALAVAWSGPDLTQLWRLLGEDGIVEWMQFLCFSVISVLLAFVASERWKKSPRVSLELLALVGLSALTALAALEEISWFQRILNVQSPEFFVQNNRQAETNLHNLALGSASLHKTVLLKLIFIVGITHNLVLPLLARSRDAKHALALKHAGATIVVPETLEAGLQLSAYVLEELGLNEADIDRIVDDERALFRATLAESVRTTHQP